MDGSGDQRPLELRGPVEAPARRRGPLVVVVLVLVASVLAVAWAAGGDRVDVAIDDPATTTTAPGERREVPDPGSFPTPIALGGPTDGTESIGLPVKAEPGTGLADGQTVTVTATGFPAGVSVGVVMCAREAGRDHGARGAAACDLGRYASAESDDDGVVTAAFTVRRLVVLDGQEVDCASEAGRCLIGVGMISDYDTSGGVLVDFDPSAPLPDPPTVDVDRTDGLADGDRIVVDVGGLVPGSRIGVALCDATQTGCVELDASTAVGPDGTASVRTTVWRAFGTTAWDAGRTNPNIDCAAEPCALTVWGEAASGRAIPSVPMSFEAGPLGRAPVVATVVSDGPYRPGDEVVVRLADLALSVHVELVWCAAEHCGAWETRTERDRSGTLAISRVHSAQEGNPCQGGSCQLRVQLYSPPGAPPPLLPEPLTIALDP